MEKGNGHEQPPWCFSILSIAAFFNMSNKDSCNLTY
jgi:hypothetical protein